MNDEERIEREEKIEKGMRWVRGEERGKKDEKIEVDGFCIVWYDDEGVVIGDPTGCMYLVVDNCYYTSFSEGFMASFEGKGGECTFMVKKG